MKVSAVIPPTGMSVECDGYVPLVARNFGDFVYCEKYWRTGDFKDTIFEFGVESTGGAICKVTITLMNELSKAVNPSSELSTIQDGTPCFDKKCWKESARVLDDSGSPTASLVNDRLIVRFSGNASGSFRGIRNGRLVYVVDEQDELNGFEVLGLSRQDVDNIKLTLRST
ncbi:MAG: hypothetical protein WCH79_14600 [Planctomycetia bacterium]